MVATRPKRRSPESSVLVPWQHVRLFPALSPVALSTANMLARSPKKRSPESSVLVSWQACSHVSCFVACCPFDSKPACQEAQEEVLRIVRFGSTGTTEPQKTSQDPLGRAQELPNSPRESPRSTPGTPEDHPGAPRHRSRAPKEPPWTPRTTGKSLFLPSLLPPPSLFPVPASLLPPPSSLIFSRPSAFFCQPLLANQSVHQPWRSLQGAGGTGRQPLRYILCILYVWPNPKTP